MWDLANNDRPLGGRDADLDPTEIFDIALSADERTFFTASRDQIVLRWDAESLSPNARIARSATRSIAAAPDGTIITSGELGKTYKVKPPVTVVQTPRESRVIARLRDGTLLHGRKFDGNKWGPFALVKARPAGGWEDEERIARLPGRPWAIDASADGRIAAVGGGGDGAGGFARLYRIDGSAEDLLEEDHGSVVSTVALSPDGSHLLTGTMGGVLRLFVTSAGRRQPFKCSLGASILAARWLPGRDLAVVATKGGHLLVFRREGTELVECSRLPLRDDAMPDVAMCIRPFKDGKRFLVGTLRGQVRLYEEK